MLVLSGAVLVLVLGLGVWRSITITSTSTITSTDKALPEPVNSKLTAHQLSAAIAVRLERWYLAGRALFPNPVLRSVKGQVMRSLQFCCFALFCATVCSGCGAARIQELTAEVERLKAQSTKLEAEKATLQAELEKAKQERQKIEQIKQGYEEARAKFKEHLKGLAPLLGDAESPLPPFEGLSDSRWVGKLTPGAKVAPQLKELESQLKDLFGTEAKKPSP